MNIELTELQQRLLDSEPGAAQVVDPRDDAHYVLVPARDFEAVRELLEEERNLQAIRRTALKNAAGRMGEAP